jgi:hypothetical protein
MAMPHFMIVAYDTPGQPERRQAHREAHLAFAKAPGSPVRAGGPLLSDDGTEMIGSLMIVEMETLDAVHAWSARDPYVTGGVFERVEIHPWRWLIGAPG